jgi:hypothetical protein
VLTGHAPAYQRPEQRHALLRAKHDQHNQTRVLIATPDMPVKLIVNIRGMCIKDTQHGYHAQPVEVVEPFSNGLFP